MFKYVQGFRLLYLRRHLMTTPDIDETTICQTTTVSSIPRYTFLEDTASPEEKTHSD